ncbi:hypothetical protein [Ferroacidibacillus organovorans]|uniref:Uncharacterized protein n=1 Tax=Ferroacidibacillus organovorans TaxID=1765683 RepID=A0A853KD61_9BACL|nr:hypothetical protein [Ferroacidibacillus organovorans]KYP81633.1 hypothetical protein AYJ22_06800 [Ferroacidibacillus organovorans]OAG94982.1 hypothetical protein AYW79_03075 [Ferroacidibacillus organovorans]
MTDEEARVILRETLTDDVMREERLRVMRAVRNQATTMLGALGMPQLLAEDRLSEQLARYETAHHIPGDHLWQAMQFFFRVAREGGDEQDQTLIAHYAAIVRQTLFTPAYRRAPQIPDPFWETPLGLAMRFVEQGVTACADALQKLAKEGESSS